ncbi:MAG: hypothetical protein JRE27_05840 [Deltaproteobacteria bacterium]|nr:hypothetical protein [Deltaproteobacteria bacterium]
MFSQLIHVRRYKKNAVVLYDLDERIEATIENFKDLPAVLTMVQQIPGQWDMQFCNLKYTLKDAYTLEFEIELPPKSRRRLIMHYHRRNLGPRL